MSAMLELFCCGTTGGRRNRNKPKTKEESPTSLNSIPMVNMQPLQPSALRTPEKLHKPRPQRSTSPRTNKISNTPSPAKRKLMSSLRRSPAKVNADDAIIEAFWQEGRQMLEKEEETKEENIRQNNGGNNTSTDWAAALNLDIPSNNPETPRRESSEFEEEMIIPIRRSSLGHPLPTAVSVALTTLNGNTQSNIGAHQRMSSQATQLRLDLAPEVQLSQRCLKMLEDQANKTPQEYVLHQSSRPAVGSSSAPGGLNSSLRKASSAINTRQHLRIPSSDYGDHNSDNTRTLKYSLSDNLRSLPLDRPPIPVPTTERNMFKQNRDKGLVSLDAFANGSSAFTTDADMKELSVVKDLPEVKPIDCPSGAGSAIEHTIEKLNSSKDKQKSAKLNNAMKEENGDSIQYKQSQKHTAAASNVGDFADSSSSIYPSQPPSRHGFSSMQEFNTNQADIPPMPELDGRLTAVKNTPARARSVGGGSARSASITKESVIARSLSKLKKGLSGKKAQEPEGPAPPPIPMKSPLRNVASSGSIRANTRQQAVNTISSNTTTTVDTYRTAQEFIRLGNSTASMRGNGVKSTDNVIHRSLSVQDRLQHTRSPTGELSIYSDRTIFSPPRSPFPGENAGGDRSGRPGSLSWMKTYDDCVAKPFGSNTSLNNRMSAYDFQNVDSIGYSTGTISPTGPAQRPVSMLDGATDVPSTSDGPAEQSIPMIAGAAGVLSTSDGPAEHPSRTIGNAADISSTSDEPHNSNDKNVAKSSSEAFRLDEMVRLSGAGITKYRDGSNHCSVG